MFAANGRSTHYQRRCRSDQGAEISHSRTEQRRRVKTLERVDSRGGTSRQSAPPDTPDQGLSAAPGRQENQTRADQSITRQGRPLASANCGSVFPAVFLARKSVLRLR